MVASAKIFSKRTALEEIPEHLIPYTTAQNADAYSFIDHAVWRFIMKIASDFFSGTAHTKYLQGLKETGISVERIPLVKEMDENLKAIGWRAAGVSGFIPPAVFLEFMALGIMPIATEIRKLENISYTPTPDIVHEAAGHAPIVADPDYNEYVRAYGEVAVKAIYSRKDLELYDAIKALSDVKERPSSRPDEIEAAERVFAKAAASVDYVSESTQLSRMAWWTIEYGLVGDPNDFKLYGAGLLSSLGESYHCLDPKVIKIPLTEDCVNMGFDITRPQPQLFVATSFEEARKVLERYASTMGYRLGGIVGLAKARTADTTTTIELDNGLQISGTVKHFGLQGDDQITFVDLEAPLQICENNTELKGLEMESLPKKIRLVLGAGEGNKSRWQMEIPGKLSKAFDLSSGKLDWYTNNGSVILATKSTKIASVFGGPADRSVFIKATWDGTYASVPHISTLTAEQIPLNKLYEQVRLVREQKRPFTDLISVMDELDKNFPGDWLLRFEIFELAQQLGIKNAVTEKLHAQLLNLQKKNEAQQEIIERGLKFLQKNSSIAEL